MGSGSAGKGGPGRPFYVWPTTLGAVSAGTPVVMFPATGRALFCYPFGLQQPDRRIMMSPEHLPDWAAWLAQDADGTWWAYEAEPNQHDAGWYENEVGRSLKLGQEAANPDWLHSITRLNR